MRYEIEAGAPEERSMIRRVRFEYLQGGEFVSALWDWPMDMRYNECVIFEVPEADAIKGITLKELLDSNRYWFTVVNRMTPSPCSRPLTEEAKQFFFFPARYENETRYVLDQKQDNKTTVWRRRTVISPVIVYEPIRTGFLGLGKATRQLATISLKGTGKIPEGYLVYRVGNDSVRYGLDLARFSDESVQLEIGINEKIIFEKPDREMTVKIELKLPKRG